MNTYTKGAFQSLKLIKRVFKHLVEQKKTENFEEILKQLEICKPRSSLSQKLDLDVNTESTQEESEYWKGILEMTSLAKKQWLLLQDQHQFEQFLQKSHESLEAKMSKVSPIQVINKQEETQRIEQFGKEFDVNSYPMKGEKGTIQKLIEYIDQVNQTVTQLPVLIRDLIEKTIESKMEEELKVLKIELKHFLTSELESHYSHASLKGENDFNFENQITVDKNSVETRVNEIQMQKEKSIAKTPIENDKLSEITLRDALKILRDED